MFHVEHCLVHPLRLSYPHASSFLKLDVQLFTIPAMSLCSTWNIVSSTHPPGYPQLCSLLTLSLISTFRCPVLVLHSFSSKNFPSGPLHHCRPAPPRSKLLSSVFSCKAMGRIIAVTNQKGGVG